MGTVDRRGECGSNAPISDTPLEVGWVHIEEFGPIGNGPRLTFKGDEMIPASVAHLFMACRPSAIAGFVVTVVVDAVNRMLFARPQTDIRQKIRERCEPSGANTNASTTVVLEVLERWISASTLNVAPGGVLGGPSAISRATVLKISGIRDRMSGSHVRSLKTSLVRMACRARTRWAFRILVRSS